MGKKAKKKNASNKKKEKNPIPDKTWCTSCQNWVEKTIYHEHVKGKKHLGKMSYKNRMRQLAFAVSQRGVIIEAPRPQLAIKSIFNHFKQFGNILALARLDSGDILVQYEENYCASRALKSPQHIIQDIKMVVKSRRKKRTLSESDDAAQPPPPSSKPKLTQQLEKHFRVASVGSLDDQVYELVAKLQASEKLKATKAQIVSDLSNWLLLKFPHHVLHMFGSSAMDLDLEDHSDMDLYLEYDPDTCMNDSQETKLKRLKTAAHILSAHPDVKQFVVVRTARVPVAKFLHTPSGIMFDLICDNIKGVKNSKFFASLHSLNPLIRPFLLTLKLWTKAQKLLGTPQVTFTSYALMLLSVFYLQKIEPHLVPPVASLQSQVPANQRAMFNGWNFSYVLPERTADEGQSPRNSIFTLLKGFFDFYQSFDPKNVVVCPLLGDVVPREKFSQTPPALDESAFETYFKHLDNGGKPFNFGQQIAVQDPFELNFNVCSAFHKYDKFQLFCKKAFNICCELECAVEEGKSVSIEQLFTMFS